MERKRGRESGGGERDGEGVEREREGVEREREMEREGERGRDGQIETERACS